MNGAEAGGGAPEELAPGTPDPFALRRRVLGTAVLTLVLFLTVAYVLTALDRSSAWLVLAVVLLYVLVVRPLMRPVHEATRLRRRLAYRAYVDGRDLRGEEEAP